MKRTVRIALKPTPKQAQTLNETLRQSTECFNAVNQYGWDNNEKNSVDLHKATYYQLKAIYPNMPSQLLCAARVKASEALKSAFALRKAGRTVSCPKGDDVPIRYDARSYTWQQDKGSLSLASVAGRLTIAYHLYHHAQKAIAQAVGFDSADLVYSKGKWHLHIVLTFPTPQFVDNGQAVGVDLGLNRPAVTSQRQFLGKRRWREVSHRYFRHRRSLAAKGTKSAKRRLRALSGKTARFRRDCDHFLSKQVVHSVTPGTTIVVENLVDIRTSAKQRGVQSRRRLHSWSFAQFGSFLTYKAQAKGCQVAAIDPRCTSQRCSLCGFIHRGNRRSQSVFRCKACRYELNADLNASINIAAKYLARDGTSVSGGLLSDSLLSQAPVVVATRVCLTPTTSVAFVSWPENHAVGYQVVGPQAPFRGATVHPVATADGANGTDFEFRDKPPSLGGGI